MSVRQVLEEKDLTNISLLYIDMRRKYAPDFTFQFWQRLLSWRWDLTNWQKKDVLNELKEVELLLASTEDDEKVVKSSKTKIELEQLDKTKKAKKLKILTFMKRKRNSVESIGGESDINQNYSLTDSSRQSPFYKIIA